MQNENNTDAIAIAINDFADAAFVLLNKLDGDALTPAAHGARLLLQSEVDFKETRDGMCAALRRIESALDALKTTPAPAAPVVDPTPTPEAAAPAAAPAMRVDAETVAALVREQVAAMARIEFGSLDLVKIAREAMVEAIDSNVDFDDVARAAMDEAIDNNVSFDDLARDLLTDKMDSDLSIDFDDEARDLLTEKVDNEFDFDVDEAAQELVENKIDENLNVEDLATTIIRDLLENKPLTITLKG